MHPFILIIYFLFFFWFLAGIMPGQFAAGWLFWNAINSQPPAQKKLL
jgi:hypothetical protein